MLILIHKILLTVSLCALAFCLSNCALPVPIGSELDGFVPARELQVVSLAREGMQLFNSSRFFESEARFRKALYLDSSLDNVRFNLATTLERTGLFNEASQIYLDLIKKDGDKAIYRAAYGRLLISMGNYEAGRAEFIKAKSLALLDDDSLLVTSLSQSLITLEFSVGHLDEAICEARELSVQTKSVVSLTQYLKLLISAGIIERANTVLETSGTETMLDDAIPSLYLRTLILFAMGNNDEALEFSERVLATPALDPAIEFDLRVVNLVCRYQNAEPGLFEREDTLGYLEILDESVKSSALSSLYWSPRMLTAVQEMLADSKIKALLEE